MKRFFIAWFVLLVLAAGCSRPVAVYYPSYPPRHDNGRHMGWHKHGKVKHIPLGQAKKMNRRRF
jgi:hypothetical protein